MDINIRWLYFFQERHKICTKIVEKMNMIIENINVDIKLECTMI